MKAKKSPRANLENKRIVFTQIGLIITLALVLLAFEWKTYDNSGWSDKVGDVDLTPEELAIITIQPIPPPPPPPVQITTIINIVDPGTDVIDEIELINIEEGVNSLEPYISDYSDKEDRIPDDIPIVCPQKLPEFPGGEEARILYLKENLRYPSIPRQTGIQGKVHVTFVVEKDGSISNIELLRGIGGGCDEEAMRVVGNMPNWKPGKQNGHPVRVRLNMRIVFNLL